MAVPELQRRRQSREDMYHRRSVTEFGECVGGIYRPEYYEEDLDGDADVLFGE